MTTTAPSAAGTATTPRRRHRTIISLATAGLTAAAAGGALLYAYGLALAATPLSLRAGDPWAASAEPVTASNFAAGVVICTLWGTLIALVLTLTARRPARTFARTAVALVAVSLLAPLFAVDTDVATKLALAAGHVLAAAVVVPLLARALPTLR